MTHRVTLIPGDGIGPEVVEAARRSSGHRASRCAGTSRRSGSGRSSGPATPLPAPSSRLHPGQRRRAEGTDRDARGSRHPERERRVAARSSICTRTSARAGTTAGVPSLYEDVDLVVVRENTEDVVHGGRVRGGNGRGEGADRLHRGDDRHPHPRRTAGSRSKPSPTRGANGSCGSRSRRRRRRGRSEGHGRRTRRTS